MKQVNIEGRWYKRSRRNITLPPITIPAQRRHRAETAKILLNLGCGWNENGLVCATLDGNPINPNTLTSGFASLVRRMVISEVTFRGLGYTHATQLFEEGVHPKIVQERLGHSTIAVTLDLYSHAVPGMQEDAAMKVDRALQAARRTRIENGIQASCDQSVTNCRISIV